MAKKQKKIDFDNRTPEEEMKLEIAEEIGVYDKVLAEGWRSLSAKESGRMGGLIAKRKKMQESGLGEEFNQNK